MGDFSSAQAVVCRQLFRSQSFNYRHKDMNRLNSEENDKRESRSLDRAIKGVFVDTFDEYVYCENGFRRFKGVRSLFSQSPDKCLNNMSDKADADSEKQVKKFENGTCESNGSFQSEVVLNGGTCENKTENKIELDEIRDTKNSSVSKRKQSKAVVRRWSLYDRERKPHFCSDHRPPEQKTRPSAWSFGGKRLESQNTKVTRRVDRSRSFNGIDNKQTNGHLEVPRSESHVSASSDLFELDLDYLMKSSDSLQIGEHKDIITEQVNGYETFKRDNQLDSPSKPSLIPRPVRTYSFSSTCSVSNSEVGTLDLENDISSRIGLQRSLSSFERQRSQTFTGCQSAPVTPVTCDNSELLFTRQLKQSPCRTRHLDDSKYGNNKTITVPEDEDGYPEPTPSSRDKTDIFHPRDFTKIDKHSAEARSSLFENFDDLISYLTENLTNDMAKLRSIFYWLVSQHLPLNVKRSGIARDSPLWFLLNIREKRASFSELFAVLCRRVHLPCVIIFGVAKSLAYEVGDKVTQKRLKNSWNAVFVQGEWRFVHPYWARQPVQGYNTGRWAVVESDQFHTDQRTDSRQITSNKINEFFFLTDPDKFITKCYPEDPEWQLLHNPITKEEFEDLPFLQPAFYQLHLEVKSHTSCVIHTDTGKVELTLGLPEERSKRYQFSYKLFIHRDWEAEGEYDEILLDRYLLHYVQDELATFEIRFPVNGVYKLEIHCRDRQKPFPSDWVCDYRIVCYEAMPDCEPLPVVPSVGWGIGLELENSGLECLTHTDAIVSLDNETVTFIRFALPKDKHVSVEADLLKFDMSREELSNHVTIEQDNEHALIQVSPPSEGEYALQIFTKEEGTQQKKNVCNFLMHRTQIVEDPELADIRNELIKATEASDVESLSLWIDRFIEKGMEDRGDLSKARKKLHLSKINRDLKEAISRKDLDFLERVMHSASDTSIKRQLGYLAEEAEAVRSRLRRLKRLQHAVLELDQKTISEMRSYPKPPAAVHGVMAATYLLLGYKDKELKKWSKIQALIIKRGKESLKRRVAEFNINTVSPEVLTRVRNILSKYDLETVQIASIGAATFYQWAYTMAKEAAD